MTYVKKGIRGINAMSPENQLKVQKSGGAAVSKDRAHMSAIGKRGGLSVSRNKEHMAAIGRLGGAAIRRKKSHATD